jgi:uncharacterized protein with HEPN domain
MPPESRKFLHDALEAAQGVEEFTRGKDFAHMQSDKLLRAGIYTDSN